MHFEQSNGWARFQRVLGRRVYIFAACPKGDQHVHRAGILLWKEGSERVSGGGIAIERKIIGRFQYLEVNGGVSSLGEGIEHIMRILRSAGDATGAVFLRWTPFINSKLKTQNSKLINTVLTVPKILVHQVPPKATLVVDITKSEEELLHEMHEKTRYNIRLAERKGVEVKRVEAAQGFDAFWTLMQDTARRDAIGIYKKEYYQKMLEVLRGGEVQAHLFLAVHGEKPLATAIIVTCEETTTYLHGGSSNEYRNLMASHLLQWRMMQFAKAKGYRRYDFWGIQSKDPSSRIQDSMAHPWAGITRFKMGFGGEVREGAGTFDIVCKPMTYSLLAVLRRLKFCFLVFYFIVSLS